MAEPGTHRILRALVDGRPRTLGIKELLLAFVRHRFTVIRRSSRPSASKTSTSPDSAVSLCRRS